MVLNMYQSLDRIFTQHVWIIKVKKKILQCLFESLDGLNLDLVNYLDYVLQQCKVNDIQFTEILSGAWTVLDDNGNFFVYITEETICSTWFNKCSFFI